MKISIITPSFNQGEFIEQTILSVLSQESTSLEYLVMDGGSQDNTIDILKRYEDRLTWISEKDNGQSHAVNKGIQQTTGDIIGWLNSDDIYYPNTIKKVSDFFLAHPEIDIVYGDANYIDRFGELMYRYPTEKWNFNRLKSVCYISQPATFFRRSVVNQYGLIAEQLNYCMDYEYWLRIANHGAKFAYLPVLFAGARVYPETKTSSGILPASIEAIDMLQDKFGFIPNEWILNYASALVKSNSNLRYPEFRFILAVWFNLWKATNMKYQGLNRLSVWLGAQQAMLLRFLRKIF